MSSWYEGEFFGPAFVLLIFSVSGMVALLVSRFILARLCKDQNLTNGQYFLWFLGEVLLVAAMVTLSNVSLHSYLTFSIGEYLDTLRYSFLIIIPPYAIGLLWFYTREKSLELEKLENAIKIDQKKSGLVVLNDEQDKPVMTIDPGNLLMIKSEDNYVQVFYTTGNDLKKELIRSSIKKIEPQIASYGFARTHRSYIVNYAKVILFKKNAKGYHICIDGLDNQVIPVSASYLPSFSNMVPLTS
jgi:hypothetical protein